MLFVSARQLEEAAEQYAKNLLSGKYGRHQKAFVFALKGELGAGKTTFARGLARGLGIRKRVASPTFVLARRYRISSRMPDTTYRKRAVQKHTVHGAGYRWLWHLDCYRLRGERDLEELGFLEVMRDPHVIAIIEWADRVRRFLPKDTVWISFRHRKNGRSVTVSPRIPH